MTVEVLIGNHSGRVGHKQPDNTVTYTQLEGPQICRLLIPDEIAADFPFCDANVRALLPKHMTEKPEWVESSWPKLAEHLATKWEVPATRPSNWEETDAN